MVNKCDLCNSGRKGSDYNGAYFSFPSEQNQPELRKKWLMNIPKPGYVPTQSSRLCELHFDPNDLETERNDSNKWRSKEGGGLHRKRRKSGAFPIIWPGYPEYYLKPLPIKRERGVTAEQRTKKVEEVQTENDRVNNISEIQKKLSNIMSTNIMNFLDSDGQLIIFHRVGVRYSVYKCTLYFISNEFKHH